MSYPTYDFTFEQYQRQAARTLEGGKPKGDLRLAVLALGVAGEAGEAADLVKKWVGHDKARDLEALKKELGDVLWYVAALATDCGLSLEDIAQANLAKLRTRFPEGFTYEAANARRDERAR